MKTEILIVKDRFVRVALPLLLAVLLVGCASPREAYVKADRSTFQAIAPRYLVYTLTDPALADADKQLRIAGIITWDERIATEERSLKIEPPAPFPPAGFTWPKTDSSASLKSSGGSAAPAP